jgi:hypothetical protein
MSDIIERISGYSDEMMQEWCSCLQRVVTQERIIKEGRGKNKRERKVLKHPTHPDVLERINNI